jgi:hypothetical protein
MPADQILPPVESRETQRPRDGRVLPTSGNFYYYQKFQPHSVVLKLAAACEARPRERVLFVVGIIKLFANVRSTAISRSVA